MLERTRRIVRNSPGRLRRAGWRFRHGRDGSVAVEFALVAVPFIALLFAIFQTALVFFAGQVFETAVADAARLIMTGQAKASNMTANAFRQEICKRAVALANCTGSVSVDVRTYADFASAQPSPPPVKDGKVDTSSYGYQQSNGGQIVLVRAVYPIPIYMDLLGLGLGDISPGTHMLVATAAFRNEPFP